MFAVWEEVPDGVILEAQGLTAASSSLSVIAGVAMTGAVHRLGFGCFS